MNRELAISVVLLLTFLTHTATANPSLPCGTPDPTMDANYADALSWLRSTDPVFDRPLFFATINSLSCLKTAAEKGDPESLAVLGMLTYRGSGITANPKKGKALLLEAIDKGSAFAGYGLALVVRHVETSKRGRKQSVALIDEAAERGHVLAMVTILERYESEASNPLDDETVLHYARRSAAANLSTGHEYLGYAYYEGGFGVQPDPRRAFIHYSAAARLTEDATFDFMHRALTRWMEDEFDYAAHSATPLNGPVADGREDVLRALLEAGQDPNWLVDGDPVAPLRNAVDQQNPTYVRLLLDAGAEPDVIGTEGWTPLSVAAFHGLQEIQQLLLDAGAEVNGLRREGEMPPLFAAASSEKPAVVAQLLAAGADPNTLGNKGWSVLALASRFEFSPIAQMLLDAGANFNGLKRDGEISPLGGAISGENLETVKTLLDLGADVNQGNSSGWRPLHFAATRDLTDVIDLLIARCADPSLANDKGLTAQQLARRQGLFLTANALQSVERPKRCGG